MRYLAIPQKTASWLLGNSAVLESLAEAIASEEFRLIQDEDFVCGPVRIASHADVAVLMHADFITGTGDEPVGFIRVEGELGIANRSDVVRGSLERAVFVINQRLQNRTFGSQFYYRKLDALRHKIQAPRAADGEALNLGWIEKSVLFESTTTRTVLLVGPAYDFDFTSKAAQSEEAKLPDYVSTVRDMLKGRNQRNTVEPHTFTQLRLAIDPTSARQGVRLSITQRARRPEIASSDMYRTQAWLYDQWVDFSNSPLSAEQRSILESLQILQSPLRLVAPAGSGKTLLMQLMTIRLLKLIPEAQILYITHNVAMEERVQQRFVVLGADDYLMSARLHVSTLSRYAVDLLKIQGNRVLNLDPEKAKQDAFENLREAVDRAFKDNEAIVNASSSLSALSSTASARRYLYEYVRAEISTVIKGRGLILDRAAYTDAESALGQLHGVLNPDERNVIYAAFEYYQTILDAYEVLDSDDVALSMLGRLLSPQWRLDRKTLGFDFVLVDEAQLFNDNERQLFALLCKSRSPYTPVAVALDEAQRMYSLQLSGLALSGIADAHNETLHVSHRLSEHIARIAFFVISESTVLFDNNFPEFDKPFLEDRELRGRADIPSIITAQQDRLSRVVNKQVREWRSLGLKQFAIVAHSELMMTQLELELPTLMHDLDFSVLRQRGEPRATEHAFVILSRPEQIGGQEFDGVISCGLEEGVVPPRVSGNHALELTLEQQSLREMYLTFTRARHQLTIINTAGSAPAMVLQRALKKSLLLSISP